MEKEHRSQNTCDDEYTIAYYCFWMFRIHPFLHQLLCKLAVLLFACLTLQSCLPLLEILFPLFQFSLTMCLCTPLTIWAANAQRHSTAADQ